MLLLVGTLSGVGTVEIESPAIVDTYEQDSEKSSLPHELLSYRSRFEIYFYFSVGWHRLPGMEQPQAPNRRPEAHTGDRQFIVRSIAFSVMVLAVVGLFSHLISPILPAAFSVMDFLSEFFVLVFVMLGGVLASQVEARRDRIVLVAGIIAVSAGTFLDVVDEFGLGWQVRAVGENAASVFGFALFYFGVQDWLRVNKEEYRKVQERNAYLAVHDPLTGLRNRAALLEHLESLIDRARREPAGYRFALLFADLDRFKIVNDTKGHEYGDHLLKQVGERLTASVRSTDLCFRLGGDEFVVALPHLHEEGDAYRVGEKLLENVRKPFHILDDEVRISVSVGIAVFPRDGSTPDELQRCADLAMYHAKSVGVGVRLFSRELQTQAEHRATLERDLAHAPERGELALWYQPIVSSDGELRAVEALARWNHPTVGIVGPETFMPVAEESGSIHEIGAWVLRTALENLRDEIEPRLPGMQVSVAISLRQLSSHDFVDPSSSPRSNTLG